MEDRLVSNGSSSNTGGGGKRSAPLFAYTDKFYEVFPYYLAIGMTYDQFWNDDCDLVLYYRKAAEIRQDLNNQQAWLAGAYIYEAFLDASPVLHAFAKKGAKPNPYRTQPYDFSEARRTPKVKRLTAQERADNKAKNYMEALMVSFNQKFQKKGGKVDGR